jgi:hypothetical protein
MSKTFTYYGNSFKQREKGATAILFLTAAEDIREWGGVPRKSASFMKGFQRALEDTHKDEVSQFFEIDESNISPTAIVVAFKPNRIKLTKLTCDHFHANPDSKGSLVKIEIEMPDLESKSTEDLASLVCSHLSLHLGIESQSEDEDEDSDDNIDEGDDDDNEENKELSLGKSHLHKFLTNLSSNQWIAQKIKEDEPRLRATLIDLLKPATIVDGQHRTFGAAFLEEKIPFPVVGLVDTEWKEEVFQFVIINQKSEPIKVEFLSSIISSSLSNSDILVLKSRLEQAGVNLIDTQIIDLVHTQIDSPFRGMIDFKVDGAEGNLSFKGMLSLAKRFRNLSTHDENIKNAAFFRQIFSETSNANRISEKKKDWKDEKWFPYFCIFWQTVKDHCETKGYSDLWQHGSNLIKVVTLQELQNIFLAWLCRGLQPINTPEELQIKTKVFLMNLNPRFFNDTWKLTSLQSKTGRLHLREALQNALLNTDYKYNDSLFKGIER